MSDRRLLQVFISSKSDNPGPGIFEVTTDPDKNLDCTCPGFMSKATCKHTNRVEKKIESSNGIYPFDFAKKVTLEELEKAMETEESFRELVIKYAKIEVY
ncbi:hypothetical protein UFOVP115_35 [uncultured Caudovirales phage]|uniref:SWIM-type domain-containing protein n=1 Tax=uncultured Caudovirales phage TaxID=2100421 RepID=A0A6J5L900_9CAUD|nr:hypothetical protein UFOVP115_35 [uncultured Caudovirales phage]